MCWVGTIWKAATGASCDVLLLGFHLGLWQHSLLKSTVGIIPVSIPSLTVSELLQQSGDSYDTDCSFLGSQKMQLNSFQVTTIAFVLEVLSFKTIRCLKEESLSQESQRSEPDLINQHITWLSLLHIQHMCFSLLLTVAWIIYIAKDLNTAIFLTVSMKLIFCRCWLEAGSILHFQA